jgi:hypothetical protein
LLRTRGSGEVGKLLLPRNDYSALRAQNPAPQYSGPSLGKII